MAPTSRLPQGKVALRPPRWGTPQSAAPQRLGLDSKLSRGRRGCAEPLGRRRQPASAGGGGADLAAGSGSAHPRRPQPLRRVLRGRAGGAGPGFRFLANAADIGKPRSFREPRRER